MINFKNGNNVFDICFDFYDDRVIVETMKAEILNTYAIDQLMSGELTVEELTASQNQTIREFITIYKSKLAEGKPFYHMQKPDLIGYSDSSIDIANAGFNLALNMVYKEFSKQAMRYAYAYVKNIDNTIYPQ